MRTLTNKQIKDGALAAHKERRLTAQNFDGGSLHGCVYHVMIGDKSCGCAIGVNLNDDEISAIKKVNLNGQHVHSIAGRIVDFEDSRFAYQVQKAHDEWASGCAAGEQKLLLLISE